ncbi:SmpA / OmlA family lipoprotein [Candidatus Kinetoplastibacterium blastocrithidii TCC012E]|uniref:SmpA / OmlA family lipoprotein n=1 Tax=Candidatus Kinetoplastidibacterium blastocrithidiae TCC012E TaxID=1208922 RepID=M1LWQ3_9PROT|nr:outer membrane protein assembly factor BamE [Candidatus Kinetoplastibacterium blastocrithidii]AFZ83832.1 hypothetical protein CKBE_00642 [Candidatus Kinetoplastibacterium blastocrithidii (ex Strigomonas culicis)]AGF49957.1 SmpA / OmlA family lipoprotein [Candidatus Kinetoplastibacterium blastocrithidii TCC012E]
MLTYLKTGKFIFYLIIATLINGCQYNGLDLANLPYYPDIEQGRIIDIKKTKLLREGLTSDQVQILLGKPIIIKEDTWEYINYYKKSNEEPKITKLTLLFVDNKLKIWYKKP